MCHRHTPSSKRNLSSKIFAKSAATYFLPLTKLPLAENKVRRRARRSFVVFEAPLVLPFDGRHPVAEHYRQEDIGGVIDGLRRRDHLTLAKIHPI